MGKPTGFLEYARQGNPCQPPLERVAYWNEFHPRLGREERQRQGARCMACGVPFCQSGAVLNGMVSGCPLHNLVPEWNDLVYRRKLGRALERLLKTNDFPEFTGRVCPALCEAACTCGLNGQPVTVKDNELGIIEEAWEQGLMSPRPPETRTGRTVAVVGSGPAGLSCAQRLNRRGHSVTVFERADRPGGPNRAASPLGETAEQVAVRVTEGLRKVSEDARRRGLDRAAVVTHGGTLMGLLTQYGRPERPYGAWFCPNCGGYRAELSAAPLALNILGPVGGEQALKNP